MGSWRCGKPELAWGPQTYNEVRAIGFTDSWSSRHCWGVSEEQRMESGPCGLRTASSLGSGESKSSGLSHGVRLSLARQRQAWWQL